MFKVGDRIKAKKGWPVAAEFLRRYGNVVSSMSETGRWVRVEGRDMGYAASCFELALPVKLENK